MELMKKFAEVRKTVEEEVKKVPEGTRVKFDKDLLENLLFEKIVINKSQNKVAKIPVWSGEFLSKIDLSDVDFENVSWSFNRWIREGYNPFEDISDVDLFDLNGEIDYDAEIIYKNTNANIDLSKSFEFKEQGAIDVGGVDFENTQLSIGNAKTVYFSETNLKGTNIDLRSAVDIDGFITDFTGVDLSFFKVDGERVFHGDILCSCNLCGTGINMIIEDKETANKIYEEIQKYNEYGTNPLYKDPLGREKEKYFFNKLEGCYFNGLEIAHYKNYESFSKKTR